MKKSARLFYLLLALPFVSLAGAADQSLVVGKDEQGVRIQILSVDGKAAKDEPVRLSPGTHKLAVACIKTEAYGALSVDTVLVLTVKPNCDYELLGFFKGKNAKVAVKERLRDPYGTYKQKKQEVLDHGNFILIACVNGRTTIQ